MEMIIFYSQTMLTHISISPNSTWLVTSRLDTIQHIRRVERVERCCLTSSTQPKCMDSTLPTCRVVSRRDLTSRVEFGLIGITRLEMCSDVLGKEMTSPVNHRHFRGLFK